MSGTKDGIWSMASFDFPQILTDSTWLEHAPFAFHLVYVLRPKTIVELGTHHGFSFFVFCQAIQRYSDGTFAYAIDTWKGDDQVGPYGDEVYERVAHLQKNFSGCSALIRATFTQAVTNFADETIDCLHIDSCHSYDDVKVLFDEWSPKLTKNAIILFHNTNVREPEFGVWQYYLEMHKHYAWFEFTHGHGLGLVAIGAVPEGLRPFFEADFDTTARIRSIYARLGRAVTDAYHAARLADGSASNPKAPGWRRRSTTSLQMADGRFVQTCDNERETFPADFDRRVSTLEQLCSRLDVGFAYLRERVDRTLEAASEEASRSKAELDAVRSALESRNSDLSNAHRAFEAELEARDRQLSETHRAFEAELEARDREFSNAQRALEATCSALEARDREFGEVSEMLRVAREAQVIKKSIIFKIFKSVIRVELKLRDKTRPLRRKLKRVNVPADFEAAAAQTTIRVQALSETPPRSAEATRPLLICVSHVSPSPPRAGNEYRINRQLRWLASSGWDILLILCPLPDDDISDTQIDALVQEHSNLVLVERNGTLRVRLARQDLARLIGGLDGNPVRSGQSEAQLNQRLQTLTCTFCPDILLNLLISVDRELHPAVVQVNYCFMTRSFPFLRKETLKIVDTHDVFSTKADKVERFGISDSLALTAEDERNLLRHADAVLAIQPDEAEELRNLGVTASIITVGVDMTAPSRSSRCGDEPVVLLVASDNPMNLKGLTDFLRFAWPTVLQALPHARLHVVGSVGKHLSGYEANVQGLGYVDDLEGAYGRARLVINPAVAGTGLKIKTLEALSWLRPIVLWPSGVDGIPPELQVYCDIMRDWFQFTRRVIEILSEPQPGHRLYEERDAIARMLSPERIYQDYLNFLIRSI